MTFEQNMMGESTSHVDIWGVSFAGRGDNKHEDPEVGACSTCFKYQGGQCAAVKQA